MNLFKRANRFWIKVVCIFLGIVMASGCSATSSRHTGSYEPFIVTDNLPAPDGKDKYAFMVQRVLAEEVCATHEVDIATFERKEETVKCKTDIGIKKVDFNRREFVFTIHIVNKKTNNIDDSEAWLKWLFADAKRVEIVGDTNLARQPFAIQISKIERVKTEDLSSHVFNVAVSKLDGRAPIPFKVNGNGNQSKARRVDCAKSERCMTEFNPDGGWRKQNGYQQLALGYVFDLKAKEGRNSCLPFPQSEELEYNDPKIALDDIGLLQRIKSNYGLNKQIVEDHFYTVEPQIKGAIKYPYNYLFEKEMTDTRTRASKIVTRRNVKLQYANDLINCPASCYFKFGEGNKLRPIKYGDKAAVLTPEHIEEIVVDTLDYAQNNNGKYKYIATIAIGNNEENVREVIIDLTKAQICTNSTSSEQWVSLLVEPLTPSQKRQVDDDTDEIVGDGGKHQNPEGYQQVTVEAQTAISLNKIMADQASVFPINQVMLSNIPANLNGKELIAKIQSEFIDKLAVKYKNSDVKVSHIQNHRYKIQVTIKTLIEFDGGIDINDQVHKDAFSSDLINGHISFGNQLATGQTIEDRFLEKYVIQAKRKYYAVNFDADENKITVKPQMQTASFTIESPLNLARMLISNTNNLKSDKFVVSTAFKEIDEALVESTFNGQLKAQFRGKVQLTTKIAEQTIAIRLTVAVGFGSSRDLKAIAGEHKVAFNSNVVDGNVVLSYNPSIASISEAIIATIIKQDYKGLYEITYYPNKNVAVINTRDVSWCDNVRLNSHVVEKLNEQQGEAFELGYYLAGKGLDLLKKQYPLIADINYSDNVTGSTGAVNCWRITSHPFALTLDSQFAHLKKEFTQFVSFLGVFTNTTNQATKFEATAANAVELNVSQLADIITKIKNNAATALYDIAAQQGSDYSFVLTPKFFKVQLQQSTKQYPQLYSFVTAALLPNDATDAVQSATLNREFFSQTALAACINSTEVIAKSVCYTAENAKVRAFELAVNEALGERGRISCLNTAMHVYSCELDVYKKNPLATNLIVYYPLAADNTYRNDLIFMYGKQQDELGYFLSSMDRQLELFLIKQIKAGKYQNIFVRFGENRQMLIDARRTDLLSQHLKKNFSSYQARKYLWDTYSISADANKVKNTGSSLDIVYFNSTLELDRLARLSELFNGIGNVKLISLIKAQDKQMVLTDSEYVDFNQTVDINWVVMPESFGSLAEIKQIINRVFK